LPTSFRIPLCILLLAGTGFLRVQAQSSSSSAGDIALTFVAQHSLKADTTETFWMEGGSAELGFNLAHGIGVVADYTSAHAGSIGDTGVPLDLAVASFGPRYRWHPDKRISIYGEGLVGVASGTNSVFPTVSGSLSNASSFALQCKGGLDYRLSPHFALRALDIGYLRATLPNAADNQQNTLRIGAGIVFRFGNS